MKRPLAVTGLFFFLSLFAASFMVSNLLVIATALLLVTFVVCLCVRSLRSRPAVVVAVLSMLAAFASYAAYDLAVWRPLQVWNDTEAELTLETLDYMEDGAVEARVIGGDLPAGTRVYLSVWTNELHPEPYDRLTGRFLLKTPDDHAVGQPNGTSKASRSVLYVQPVSYMGEDIALEKPASRPPMIHILNLRRSIRMTLLSRPELDRYAGLLSGMAFGFKADVPADIGLNFTTVGVSHLLAVSGLHTSLVAHAVLWLLLRLRMNRRAAGLAASAVVIFFVALTGFSASAMRAGVMCVVLLLGLTLGREPDSLNSLGLAALAVTLFDPYGINDAGLQLSFAATFGLLILWPLLRKHTSERLRAAKGPVRFLAVPAEMAGISLCATIPTLPVLFAAFGRVSLIAPLANILMVYPSMAAILLTFVALLLCAVPFVNILASPVFILAKWICACLDWSSADMARIPFASVSVSQPFLMAWLVGAMLLIWLGWRLKKRPGLRVAALWSVIALLGGLLSNGIFMWDVTTVVVAKAGSAHAVLIQSRASTGLVLIGASGTSHSLAYFLSDQNVDTLDYLFLPDQSEGAISLSKLMLDNVAIRTLVAGGGAEDLSLSATPFPPVSSRRYWSDGAVAFGGGAVRRIEGGWVQVTVGDTRILICPDGESAPSASELPAGVRETHLVVYSGTPPPRSTVITALAGVQSCSLWDLPYAAKTLPQGLYPIRSAARDSVTLYTRGRGDIQFQRRLSFE